MTVKLAWAHALSSTEPRWRLTRRSQRAAEKKWLNGWSAVATFEGEFSDVTRSTPARSRPSQDVRSAHYGHRFFMVEVPPPAARLI
jgi:hypothetical protein